MKECSLHSKRGRLILTATILASGLAFLAATMIGIALPSIQAHFDTSISGIQWVVNGYSIALAALILFSGVLGDRYGRKRIFSFGIAVFAIGSLFSGLSESIVELILFQGFAGIGAAMMIPGSLSIINVCFKEEHRGQAIGLWAGFSGGIGTFGPLIGGWIVEILGWPFVFYFSVPVGVFALVFTLLYVPESRNPRPKTLDLWGTLFIIIGLFGLSFSFMQGSVLGWGNVFILASLAMGLFSLFAFVFAEMHVKDPLVPFSIFKNHLVLGANLVTFILYFSLQGLIFFLILNFQQVQNFSPTKAGLALIPAFLLITFLAGPAGKLSDKIGPRVQMILGPLLVAIAMALFLFPSVGQKYVTHFLPALVLFSLGMAFTIAPLTKSALSVKREDSGLASGINNAVSRIAALFAVALLGAVMTFAFTGVLENEITSSSLSTAEKRAIMEQSNKVGGIIIPEYFSESAREETEIIVKKSFVFGFRWIIGVCATLAFIASVISFIFIRLPAKRRLKTTR